MHLCIDGDALRAAAGVDEVLNVAAVN